MGFTTFWPLPNPEPDVSSCHMPNFEPDLGPVRKGSGLQASGPQEQERWQHYTNFISIIAHAGTNPFLFTCRSLTAEMMVVGDSTVMRLLPSSSSRIPLQKDPTLPHPLNSPSRSSEYYRLSILSTTGKQ